MIKMYRHKLTATLVIAACLTGQAQAEARTRIVLHNNSNDTIVSVYASSVTDTAWHSDRLAHQQVAPGEAAIFDLRTGVKPCRFDFKTISAIGRITVQRNVDTCSANSVELNSN